MTDTRICPRCTKILNLAVLDGVHTCTPTAQWWELEQQRDGLLDALRAILTMDVKGHQLQDRLQFSTPGRALLDQCNAAIAQATQP